MKILPHLILLLMAVPVIAQKKGKEEKLFLFDSKWESAKTENAVYLVA